MAKLLVHEYNLKIEGVSPKIIYQFSDVHLNLNDELSSDEEKADTESRIANWHRIREKFTTKYGEPYGDDQRLELTSTLKIFWQRQKRTAMPSLSRATFSTI